MGMKVAFIGTGSMGAMLVRALVHSGALRPGQVWAANRGQEKLLNLVRSVPGIHATSAAEAVRLAQVVFLGVKPTETAACLADLDDHLTADQILIILSNMLELADVEQRVPCRVVKVIPSLAHSVLGGVSLLTFGSRITAPDRELVVGLLARISKPYVIREDLGRICSDLTSCGPAFIAAVLKEMANAACQVQPELPAEVADALVRETALATARLLTEGGLSCADVMQRIAVPGGITAEALSVLSDWAPSGWQRTFFTTHRSEEKKRTHVHL